MLPTLLFALLFALPATPAPELLHLHLRHMHAATARRILFADVAAPPHALHTRVQQTFRRGADGWAAAAVPGPDTASRATLLELAKMANNAYVWPGDEGWYELGRGWNAVRAPPLARLPTLLPPRALTPSHGRALRSGGKRARMDCAGTCLRRRTMRRW